MIRTSCFKKAIGMFNKDAITGIQASRGLQKTMELHKLGVNTVPYFEKRERHNTDWYLDWNGPGNFNPQIVEKQITKEELGDFIIERVEYSFESEALGRMLNDIVAKTCAGKKVGKVSARERFHATFTNNYNMELKDVPYLKELNQHEIDKYRFKVSCLDLIDLHTDRVERYGEKENISLNDTTMIREILRSLDWNGWPQDQRMFTNKDDIPTTVKYPVAIRQYVLSDNKKWIYQHQEELNGD